MGAGAGSRLRLDMIDWGYPSERAAFNPTIWDLKDESDLMRLVLSLGNGTINELRAEAESQEALDALRGLVTGVGACERVELDVAEQSRFWFYRSGDEVFRQGSSPNAAHIFVDPVVRTGRFRNTE